MRTRGGGCGHSQGLVAGRRLGGWIVSRSLPQPPEPRSRAASLQGWPHSCDKRRPRWIVQLWSAQATFAFVTSGASPRTLVYLDDHPYAGKILADPSRSATADTRPAWTQWADVVTTLAETPRVEARVPDGPRISTGNNLQTVNRMAKPNRRIAVVDDDPAVRRALARLLNAASYEVQTFAGAREFIDALPDGVPECALVDLHMPDMTGLDLQHYLADAGIAVPTIVITAHDEPGNREMCIAAGAAAYLLKPVRKAVLMSAVLSALGAAGHGPGNLQ